MDLNLNLYCVPFAFTQARTMNFTQMPISQLKQIVGLNRETLPEAVPSVHYA
jgi:hypothetical protein